jgi:FixJ family two-component response regulator
MVKEDLVFIIDDDLVQNEIHTMLLNKIYPNILVKTYTDATRALQDLNSFGQPGTIFLDLHMPGQDVAIFLEAHKSRGLTGEIYLMSSLVYFNDARMMSEYPAIREFISKPLLEYKLKSVFNHYA